MMEVEKEDPIDFPELPFEEDDLRSLTVNHLCEMAQSLESFSEEDRHITLLAVAAKLVLENMVLHIQLLRRHSIPLSQEMNTLLQSLQRKK